MLPVLRSDFIMSRRIIKSDDDDMTSKITNL